MGTTVGAIIRELREERKMTRKKLCRGLCTPQFLAFIENDTCETDQYLFNILLQRLGKCPDKLELILSEEEYRRMRVRDMIEELCWKKKKDKALYLLEKYSHGLARESNVQRMYEYRVRAFISRRIDGDVERAEEYIRHAVEITMPGITLENMQEYMISNTELENLLALSLCRMERGKKEQAEKLLKSCRDYINKNVTDEEEHAKVYAKCGWLLSKIYIGQGRIARAYDCCEEAIEGLRKFGNLYFMIPLLEQLNECSITMGVEEKKNQWKIYLEILRELYEKYGKPWYCHDSLFHNPHNTAYHLDSEFIRQERKAQDMTQEELIEGVYQSAEPLSRVENGRARPTRSKLEGLFENLGIERGRLCGTIAVKDFKVLELQAEIDILIGQWRYEEAEKLLSELSKALNAGWKINRIMLEYYREMLQFYTEKSSLEETLDKLKELLRQSYWVKKEEYGRVPLQSELLILNQMGILLVWMNRIEEAIWIWRQIIGIVHNSKMNVFYRHNIISLPYANLAVETGSEKNNEKGLQYELKCDKGIIFPYYLHTLALADKQCNIMEYLSLVRKAYYICKLFYREGYSKKLLQLYKESGGAELY